MRECRARAPGAIIVPAAPPPRKIDWSFRADLSFTPGEFTLPRAARAHSRVAQQKQAARGLSGGGRDFFLRALGLENDDDENEHHREDNGRGASDLNSHLIDADTFFGGRGPLAGPGRRHCASYSARFV